MRVCVCACVRVCVCGCMYVSLCLCVCVCVCVCEIRLLEALGLKAVGLSFAIVRVMGVQKYLKVVAHGDTTEHKRPIVCGIQADGITIRKTEDNQR